MEVVLGPCSGKSYPHLLIIQAHQRARKFVENTHTDFSFFLCNKLTSEKLA